MIHQKNNSKTGRITILLAEDRTLAREAWSFILQKDPRFQVIAKCDSPESALLHARYLNPDVVILEIKPPDLSGIEMVSLVDRFSPGSKVLAVSLYTFPDVAREVMKAGAAGYLTKTSNVEEMFQALIDVTEGKNYLCREIKKTSGERSEDPVEPGSKFRQLSIREIEVAVGITNGLASWKIAKQLHIAGLTVEMHRYRMLKKLKLDEDSELVSFLNKCQCLF